MSEYNVTFTYEATYHVVASDSKQAIDEARNLFKPNSLKLIGTVVRPRAFELVDDGEADAQD